MMLETRTAVLNPITVYFGSANSVLSVSGLLASFLGGQKRTEKENRTNLLFNFFQSKLFPKLH